MRLATVGKLLGIAGLAGVAATGAVLARDERQRRAYTPDDVRARLHARAEAATQPPAAPPATPAAEPQVTDLRGWLRHLPHRLRRSSSGV